MPLNLNPPKKINFKTIMLCDFDDSFFPTFWVNQNMISLSSEESINEYKLYFIELDKTISDFLVSVLTQTEIYFVTNASLKWIKVCLNVLPKTRKIIMENNIRIVSARDNYSQTLSSPTEWKINTFRDIVSKVVNNLSNDSECNTILNIISIGDANYEYIALLNLDNYFKNKNNSIGYLLKSIKFIERPHFDLVIDQIQVVKRNINTIINKVGYVDLKFAN
jgi:hypothetical protein